MMTSITASQVSTDPELALPTVGTGGRLQPPSAEVSSSVCAGQTAGVTDWRINEIAQIVEPDEAQRAGLEELKTAMVSCSVG